MPQRGFSGSYPADWVNFLLNTVSTEMTPVEEKERLIQSGEKHYSDMLSEEPEPSEFHLELYQGALETGSRRLAGEVMALAKALINNMPNQDIVLVSLVRAGVPLGVLLHLALKKLGVTSFHYGISIIRDRGIDDVAMKQIEQQHGTQGTVFVDGWTGKGAITQELRRSLSVRPGYPEQDRLVVLADVCGSAWLSASTDDWLIPFGILGAPVSGLISRSIWSADDYHGSVQVRSFSKIRP
ncbi:Citrate lyase beta subunit [Budvicia aquatica]|uniref:Citrate lyase beta subunit n=1 Tax=Budvicia aquatica TaxID=82979 RepID=A0A484ZGX2_9GAMM|nr:Citrate lyase beta subunit [Budvicia aquatica]